MRGSIISALVLALITLGNFPVYGQQGESPSPEVLKSLPLPQIDETSDKAEDAVAAGNRAECAWLGKRTVRVLIRDDLIAAEGFYRFYQAFDCSPEHLGRAFACAIPAAVVEDRQALQKHAAACWNDPEAELTITPPENQEGGRN
jgi:hypothetical protein